PPVTCSRASVRPDPRVHAARRLGDADRDVGTDGCAGAIVGSAHGRTGPGEQVGGVLIRDARAGDLPAITDLSNAMVTTSTIAWTDTPETLAQREAWFEHQQAEGNPVLVADIGGAVVGYATYADFRDSRKWPGYRFTIEHTVHVHEE